MPQRGYGLQPRVAASATLGTSKKRNLNRNAVASFSPKRNTQSRRNRVAVEGKIAVVTQGSRSGNPGLEDVAPLGHSSEPIVSSRGIQTFTAKPFNPALHPRAAFPHLRCLSQFALSFVRKLIHALPYTTLPTHDRR